jgi:hypothetical protein
MPDAAEKLLTHHLEDGRLLPFAARLINWLRDDLSEDPSAPAFTESRAKALLRAAGVVDDPTLNDFKKLIANPTAVRLALHDLLTAADLAEDEEVNALAATTGAGSGEQTETAVDWLALAVAAQAWKSEYPLHQLDPASPPGPYSPAGQLVKRAAGFLRQQIQRSATDRDKLARKLAYTGGSGAPSLDEMANEQPVAPVPPHFRTPVPVRYPEYARETLQVEDETSEPASPPVTRNPRLTITADDLAPAEQPPMRMPEIKITREQVQTSHPATRRPSAQPGPSVGHQLGTAVRNRFGKRETMRSTKLRVVVQEVQNGPGLYGVQVRVSCQGIKATVAGTTNDQGTFLCELPVRVRSGLTYDVDVTWPHDLGGSVERKSVTLNADRTEFTLPFFRRLRD